MKKLILILTLMLSLIFALTPTIVIAATDNTINFPDRNFEVAVRKAIGKSTGPITRADVAGVTKLDVSLDIDWQTIASLSGIEYFTALTTLYCNNNQLTKLDISKNTALKELSCSSNQLTTLDVSNNSALTMLNCSGNQLDTLNVGKNTALKVLYCSYNKLTELKVSGVATLNELRCSYNQLDELDVSKNPALTVLECSFNNLAELDVRKNPALEQLNCVNNQLTSLDLSNNTALTQLFCSENALHDKAAIIGLDENKLVEFNFVPQKAPGISAPNLETASQWAWGEIISAYNKGFIPEEVQENYYSIITRREFCRMAVMFVEYTFNKHINDILAERGLSRNLGVFSDTSDPYILAASALGITNGTKAPTETQPGTFTPDGQFSRQEAATMLMRTCKAIGMDIENPPVSDFTDLYAAYTWAQDGINFVRARGIMQGTSTTSPVFNPRGTYTRQESIITFDRIQAD